MLNSRPTVPHNKKKGEGDRKTQKKAFMDDNIHEHCYIVKSPSRQCPLKMNEQFFFITLQKKKEENLMKTSQND